MKVICISGKSGSGKDHLAKVLAGIAEKEGKEVLIIHYADLLKFICRQYFGWDGVKDENGRTILQHVGTDIIRRKAPNFWVNFVVNFLGVFSDQWDYVIIPDARFPNEIKELRAYGFDVTHIRINRPGFDNGLTEEQQKHESETALDNYPANATVPHDGDADSLFHCAEKLAVWLGMSKESAPAGVVFHEAEKEKNERTRAFTNSGMFDMLFGPWW